jgi:hypothetical protein
MPPSSGIPLGALAGLILAVFTVSIGFGVTLPLPLLPFLIERLLRPDWDASQVSRATGLLTSLYMFSRFLFAPRWDRLSESKAEPAQGRYSASRPPQRASKGDRFGCR